MAHSAASQRVKENHSVAVKRPGRDAVVYCPVWETEKKILRHSVEYIITFSGENSTMLGEYRISYNASPLVYLPVWPVKRQGPGPKLKKKRVGVQLSQNPKMGKVPVLKFKKCLKFKKSKAPWPTAAFGTLCVRVWVWVRARTHPCPNDPLERYSRVSLWFI